MPWTGMAWAAATPLFGFLSESGLESAAPAPKLAANTPTTTAMTAIRRRSSNIGKAPTRPNVKPILAKLKTFLPSGNPHEGPASEERSRAPDAVVRGTGRVSWARLQAAGESWRSSSLIAASRALFWDAYAGALGSVLFAP